MVKPRFDLMHAARTQAHNPPALSLVHCCLPLKLNSLRFLKKTQRTNSSQGAMAHSLKATVELTHSRQSGCLLAHCSRSISADCKRTNVRLFVSPRHRSILHPGSQVRIFFPTKIRQKWYQIQLNFVFLHVLFILFFKIFIFERESEHVGRRAEREGRQRIRSGLCANSRDPDVGLELTNCEIKTWAKVRCSTDWATQALLLHVL